MSILYDTILRAVQTDSTFSLTNAGCDVWCWVGKCIHCNRKLSVRTDGKPLGAATLEHIRPRHHGGTNDPSNLAIACNGCNHEKGRRHDKHKAGKNERAEEVIEKLLEKRKKRWRDP